MSPIDAYLAELRAALGDRLPPSVHTARLRETRAHLLESAQGVGEAEAVRRYGRARAVANGLVRASRGYDARSAWSLALPLAAGFLAVGVASSLYILLTPRDQTWDFAMLGWRLGLLLILLAFAGRVVQTRRWLAAPMAAAHAAGIALILLNNHLFHQNPWTRGEFVLLALYVAAFAAAWLALNALALGLGTLLDLRQVRRAGGAR